VVIFEYPKATNCSDVFLAIFETPDPFRMINVNGDLFIGFWVGVGVVGRIFIFGVSKGVSV